MSAATTTSTISRRKKRPFYKNKQRLNEAVNAYIFIAPLLIGICCFGLWPILNSFWISFQDWNGFSEAAFVGLKNYIDLTTDPKVRHELRNTVVYAVCTVFCSILISLGVANMLNKRMRGTGLFRVLYFLPNVTMPVAVALVWMWLYNSKYGIINMFLGLLHLPEPGWVSDPNWILTAVIIVKIWSSVGYNSVILLAGMQGVSPALYEAARIDGAKSSTLFWKITLPMITPSLFFLLTVSIMNAMREFDIVFIFSGAGISSSAGTLLDALRTLVYGIYQNAFNYMKMGYASAESVFLFFIIMILTAIQFKMEKSWVFYN